MNAAQRGLARRFGMPDRLWQPGDPVVPGCHRCGWRGEAVATLAESEKVRLAHKCPSAKGAERKVP